MTNDQGEVAVTTPGPARSQGPDGFVTACPKCGCRDLFVRKDFPQKVGLFIVLGAAGAFLILAASRTHFYLGATVLLVAAAIDAALYVFVPKITVCYRC